MNENVQHHEKPKNRKRKKTVLGNARKYAKKGAYGRGSNLSEDKYQYFVRVLELHKAGFETEEEKVIFANNVFDETENEEIEISCNQIGCRIIETLLPFANATTIDRYINAFDSNLRQYCSDRFASHVLQALLRNCCRKSLTETDEEIKNKCKLFTLKISKFLLNNLEDYINDIYGNQIIRTVFESFANIPNEKEVTIKLEIPEEYTDIVLEYANRLIVWPHFKDLPYVELSSRLLQILIQALEKIDLKLLKKIIKKLLDESFIVISENKLESEHKIPDVFESKSAIMLLETCISVAKSKNYTQIYAKCFVGNLTIVAKTRIGNFSVQKLLNHCTEKTEFEAIFDELADSFEDILACGHTGVILAIAQSCKRLSAKQGNFVQSLMKALHCVEPQDRQTHFVSSVVRLVPYERLESFEDQHYFVSLHGSLLLQTMLDFNKPIKIVQSILKMDPKKLEKLFSDAKGSHIIDSYVKSQFVGEKSREKLVWHLQGIYQGLAVSKFGSWSIETIWSAANLKQRLKIMEELSYKDALWATTEYGKIVASKFNLQLYKRNKEEWKQFVDKTDKTKDMFADIIGEGTVKQ